MHEKRINEFCSAHVQRLRFTVIRIILIMECHTGIIHRIDSAVTDGAAEYIPGKIGNCITKAIKRFFDMRNPVLMIKLVDECFPFILIAKFQTSALEIKFFLLVILLQCVQKFSTINLNFASKLH